VRAATLRSLKQLGRKVTGGRPHLLREQERLRQAGPRMRGKRIVVDPGHGGMDRGVATATSPRPISSGTWPAASSAG
jgi:N-acetylmuramoyl-L-alanine amidase